MLPFIAMNQSVRYIVLASRVTCCHFLCIFLCVILEHANHGIYTEQGPESVALHEYPNFTAGPYVTRRDPPGEITSFLSTFYTSDNDKMKRMMMMKMLNRPKQLLQLIWFCYKHR